MTTPPRLAIATGPLWRLDLNESFGMIKAAGADSVEVLVTQSSDTQNPQPLERLAQKHDLDIVAIHAPTLLLTRRVFTTDPVEKIRRTMELCRALDVKTIVLHPPYLWQLRYALWLLHELEDALAGTETMITMENMYPVHVGNRRLSFHRYSTMTDLRRFEHLTLDTSHLAVSERDIVEAYEQVKDKVVHIHLSDNRGKGRDSHAPPGEGILPLDTFVQALDPARLRSIALEVNPGPADGRERLEAVFGSALDMVRSNLAGEHAAADGTD